MKPEYNQDQGKYLLDFHTLESDIYDRMCVAEALQVKDIGRFYFDCEVLFNTFIRTFPLWIMY